MDDLLNQKNQDIVLLAPGNSVNLEVPTINIDTNQERIMVLMNQMSKRQMFISHG